MTKFNIVLLPGDGIGPEVTNAAKSILEIIEEQYIGGDEDRNNNIKESVTE